ncbi:MULTISPECIES: 3-oxoacyl-[acyl-carrier-protein] reductase [unclassified Enterococcus]|uniref:3-oxoacyl-[acyl-carrier-protein] reductase n=1 Tax=unclassified Enterococcus TaxID=2608891 RepID=UPI000A340451|nr:MULTISPECIES: 3-oxoacyl-[acyl-carrier-protein] reductase [unclassified Enterococcus]OTO76689.1 3-oxoacyl-[acyl-carrier-protein] reductase [Enterococcus sp. 12E11_DIV0728]OUZ17149.1 3-oxoacyl-[acyl-carrier-protein] reductase [Enterococcus sp. 12F9_DIV0723]
MELTNKTVFITGSSRGIGWGIAKAFAQAGANIVLNGRKEIPAEKVAEIEAFNVKCISICGDISSFEDAGHMIKECEDTLGTIDILINNAGITKDQLLLRMKPEDFDAVMDINLKGTFNMTQQVLKKMMKKRAGAIINLSSVVGLIGNVGQCNYAASKAGVLGFTKAVAREVAPRGITCNAIAPGFIKTDMTNELNDKVKEQMEGQIPLKSFGTVEDVANAALFLAQSEYITGQVLNVDGGMVM